MQAFSRPAGSPLTLPLLPFHFLFNLKQNKKIKSKCLTDGCHVRSSFIGFRAAAGTKGVSHQNLLDSTERQVERISEGICEPFVSRWFCFSHFGSFFLRDKCCSARSHGRSFSRHKRQRGACVLLVITTVGLTVLWEVCAFVAHARERKGVVVLY